MKRVAPECSGSSNSRLAHFSPPLLKKTEKLAKNHVKSDYNSLGLVYQGYITKGLENLKQSMVVQVSQH